MKEWGYGEGYQHAHQFDNAINQMECLPPSLAGTRFYEPTDRGIEKPIDLTLRSAEPIFARSKAKYGAVID